MDVPNTFQVLGHNAYRSPPSILPVMDGEAGLGLERILATPPHGTPPNHCRMSLIMVMGRPAGDCTCPESPAMPPAKTTGPAVSASGPGLPTLASMTSMPALSVSSLQNYYLYSAAAWGSGLSFRSWYLYARRQHRLLPWCRPTPAPPWLGHFPPVLRPNSVYRNPLFPLHALISFDYGCACRHPSRARMSSTLTSIRLNLQCFRDIKASETREL